MAVVALDTSALMTAVQHDVRLFDELDRLVEDVDAVTVPAVRVELERLATGAGTEATSARVGRDLADDRCRLVDPPTAATAGNGGEHGNGIEGGYDTGDDALVALAEAGRVDYVATNDRPLRDRILAAGVPVIGLRGRNKLELIRP
ncbi:MAG: twitching motility protein PilT [Halobacteriales archaeon]|nr:twitching motility protein PilT [Halobacteriales archaeon]